MHDAHSIVLVASSGPIIARRISLSTNYFLYRQIVFSFISIIAMLGISFLSVRIVYLLSIMGFLGSLLLLYTTMVLGIHVKGASRWLSVSGISIQASEFIKPFFAVVTAKILSSINFKKYYLSFTCYIVTVMAIIVQPDFGTSLLLSGIWATQLFVSGLPYIYLIGVGLLFVSGTLVAYLKIPYLSARLIAFLNSEHVNNFQIKKSLAAFKAGKMVGAGPGEGSVKLLLPDSHTDFIFAVAAEEFGAIACMLILLMYGIIAVRIWCIAYCEYRKFHMLTVFGLLTQFSMQFMINTGVAMKLLPTTGIALPLLSYGGSSLLSTGILIGIVLAFGKEHKITSRTSTEIQ